MVGLNCQYDYTTSLRTVRLMKQALGDAGLHPFLMLQALGYRCPEAEHCRDGYFSLPEYPFGMRFLFITSGKLHAIKAAVFRSKLYKYGITL